MRKRKKRVVTRNFSFSHHVFYSYISLVCQNAVLCGNGLNCSTFGKQSGILTTTREEVDET